MSYEVEITQDCRGYHARLTGEIRELYQCANFREVAQRKRWRYTCERTCHIREICNSMAFMLAFELRNVPTKEWINEYRWETTYEMLIKSIMPVIGRLRNTNAKAKANLLKISHRWRFFIVPIMKETFIVPIMNETEWFLSFALAFVLRNLQTVCVCDIIVKCVVNCSLNNENIALFTMNLKSK